jgi:hypothetical protein
MCYLFVIYIDKKIMQSRPNIGKFSFGELTSNTNGKTSGSGTAGIYIVAIGGLCFILGCVDKMFLKGTTDIITQSIVLIGIGAALLGYRKSKDANVNIPEQEEEKSGDQMLNS